MHNTSGLICPITLPPTVLEVPARVGSEGISGTEGIGGWIALPADGEHKGLSTTSELLGSVDFSAENRWTSLTVPRRCLLEEGGLRVACDLPDKAWDLGTGEDVLVWGWAGGEGSVGWAGAGMTEGGMTEGGGAGGKWAGTGATAGGDATATGSKDPLGERIIRFIFSQRLLT